VLSWWHIQQSATFSVKSRFVSSRAEVAERITGAREYLNK
jgi:hypothetical protein